MVLHLISEDIYIDLVYNSWTSGGNGGGFSYTQSTNPALSISDLNISKIKFYPNPTSNLLYNKNLKKQNIEIYNILGNKLHDIFYDT